MSEPIKVLLLAADPVDGSAGLRIDREIRRALEAVRMGRAESTLEIVSELAVQRGDLEPALLRHDPQIVHFAGHGDGEGGLVLDDGKVVRGDELAALFTSFTKVRAAVLIACETLPVARALGGVVDYTVAMETDIYDDEAVAFSGLFYAALAFGRTVPFAFELARGALQKRFGQACTVPHLLVRPGAAEWPPEDRPVSQAELTRLVNVLADVDVDGNAEVLIEAPIGASRAVSAINEIKRTKVGGDLKVGHRLT